MKREAHANLEVNMFDRKNKNTINGSLDKFAYHMR